MLLRKDCAAEPEHGGAGRMLNGIYGGGSALLALERQQELTSSNLANLQTAGHRRATLSMGVRFSLDGKPLPGTIVNGEAIDFSQGTLQSSGRPLDVALDGQGFLSVQANNEVLFTRNGVLFRSADGTLMNSDGWPVLGTGGPITIPPDIGDSEVSIGADGTVAARGQNLGQLAITAFADPSQLVPRGQVYFQAAPGLARSEATARVIQGSRELSNAHPVTELVSLIVTSRLYEASQRSIRTISDAVQQFYRS